MSDVQDIKICASILAADFSALGDAVAQAESAGADRIHVDVMDGHFVPNISIGTPVVASLRSFTKLALETHLMIQEPARYAEPFRKAGSDSLLIHVEEQPDLHRTIESARQLGAGVGVVINPATSADAVDEFIDRVDQILVMTVVPGFGGQSLIADTLEKVRKIRDKIDSLKLNIELSVDGGIDANTAPEAVAAGANVLVAGSSIFRNGESIREAICRLRKAAVG